MKNQDNKLYKFHPIPNFPWYLINKMGQIWCKEHKYLKNGATKGKKWSVLRIAKEGLVNFSTSNKYSFVSLKNLGTFRVADLVAYTFLPFDFERRIVNHKNTIRKDDRLENLEYVSKQEDIIHMHKNMSKTIKDRRSLKMKQWHANMSEAEKKEHCLKTTKWHKEMSNEERAAYILKKKLNYGNQYSKKDND